MVSEDLKRRVLDTWGIRLTESYGLTEAVTAGAGQCPRSDRLHLSDLTAFAEVLHPETAEPVAPGEPGILVLTTFYPFRQLTPLLRYWTDDLVVQSPDPICVCGAVGTQILDILGRAGHMVTIGMMNYYPQTVGDPLVVIPELVQPPRFTLRTEMGEKAQRAILEVEVSRVLPEEEARQLRERIEESVVLSRHWEVAAGSVTLDVRLCPAGSIERPFPYKHRAT
jgi:phenylacetate-CoA ligase